MALCSGTVAPDATSHFNSPSSSFGCRPTPNPSIFVARDLKPENILLVPAFQNGQMVKHTVRSFLLQRLPLSWTQGENPTEASRVSNTELKISDFGLAKMSKDCT